MSELPVSESFILTMCGIITGFIGATLTYCLRSRCSEIKCCGIYCKREVIPPNELNSATIRIPSSQVQVAVGSGSADGV